MATPAAMSSILLVLVLVAFSTSGARAATFAITNHCASTVFPAAIPVGGGTELKPGETWTFTVDAGTAGRIWPRTGCSFDPITGLSGCSTGDCGGSLRCAIRGKPPATLAEFSIGKDGAPDNYSISVADGFNIPMDFDCITVIDGVIQCRNPGCPDASHQHGDGKYRLCMGDDGDSYYVVVFCPST